MYLCLASEILNGSSAQLMLWLRPVLNQGKERIQNGITYTFIVHGYLCSSFFAG